MSRLDELKFLTVAEVAVLLRVSKMTVYRLAKDGELDGTRRQCLPLPSGPP